MHLVYCKLMVTKNISMSSASCKGKYSHFVRQMPDSDTVETNVGPVSMDKSNLDDLQKYMDNQCEAYSR